MSELDKYSRNSAEIRWTLLTGASVLALSTCIALMAPANAGESDRPNVWIEFGGQLSRLGDSSEAFAPDFTSMRPSNFSSPQKFEKSPLYSFDEYGKFTLQPHNSDWVFSAAVRYGRSTANRHSRQQTYPSARRYNPYPALTSFNIYHTEHPQAARFADTEAHNNDQHTIIDFQAGKDVGLGLFAGRGSSVVNLGVRFAQFVDKSNITLKSDPDWRFQYKYFSTFGFDVRALIQPYHSNAATLQRDRSFHGLGPSLSWNGSTPFAGDVQKGELDFDWGVNAAILFGRQKARILHDTKVRYNTGGRFPIFYGTYGAPVTVYHHAPALQERSHNVVVPNIGGFAGMSFKYDAAKVSFGYRADFFFGAMDGGIDTRKTYDRNFYGPYASISIGLP